MADSTEDIQTKALSLLQAIKESSESSGQPVFVSELARDLRLGEEEANAAFRYLAGKRWVDIFSIPYTGRINAAGQDVLREAQRRARTGYVQAEHPSSEWDAFISHASEDKEQFARPLAGHLQQHGLRIWFDEFTLTVGDSLRRSIDRGLAKSRFGIVVISPNFLHKEWPQRELDGLVAREIEGVKVILPVWHNIGAAQIRAYSPTLADRIAASSENGLDYVVDQLLRAIRRDSPTRQVSPVSAPFIATAEASQIGQDSKAQQLARYATEFHRRRVQEIAAGQLPIPVLDGGMLLMHVVPFDAIEDQPAASFDEISRNPGFFPPILDNYPRDSRISYDGLLTGSNAEGLTKPQRAYVKVSRSGLVEAVVTSLARGRSHKFIELPHIQAIIIKYSNLYVRSLNKFYFAPAFEILVSLVHVEGMRLLQDFIGSAIPEDIPSGLLDRTQLHFGQAALSTIPADYDEGAKMLKPILVHLANAAGLSSSPYFDADGNYLLKL
jgi:TIR domain